MRTERDLQKGTELISTISVTDDLKSLVLSLQARVDKLDGGKADAPAAKAAPAPAEEDDDDVDLFGSDDEEDDEEKKRITEERLKAYHEKKAKKPKVIAKTSVLFDVKPWDDETDMDVSNSGVVLGYLELTSPFFPGDAEGVQVHRDGGPGVGSQQARPCRLRDQQAPGHVRGGGREGLH